MTSNQPPRRPDPVSQAQPNNLNVGAMYWKSEALRLEADNARLREVADQCMRMVKDAGMDASTIRGWLEEDAGRKLQEVARLRAGLAELRAIIAVAIADRRIEDIMYRAILPSGKGMLAAARAALAGTADLETEERGSNA
jgi:hypothetical protein